MITTTTRQHALRAPLPGRATVRIASSIEHQAMLAARLTARDKWLLTLLHEHRVLTSRQIQDCAFPSERSARQRLRDLYLWRVISRFQPFRQLGSAPMHYVLGPAGAAVLAAEHGLEVKDLGYRHDRAMAIAHNQRLAHTIGVGDFFTSLIAGKHRSRWPGELVTWWSEARCARHFGDLVIPDGYGRWRTGDDVMEWFLEYDTGTEALTKVGRKLIGYARLADSTGIATPVLLWLPSSRREAGARAALARVHAQLDHPRTVPVATAAADLLSRSDTDPSPASAVWLPLTTARADRAGPRYSLAELVGAWPGIAPPAETVTTGVHPAEPDSPAASPFRLPPPTPVPPPATPNRVARKPRRPSAS
ncbi:replication-relaxation family protein [Amycolatopsis sp. WQ 127309]|uniref:replication-relaxation family protein n=1 Tax=Amycolatopsis sp. WQ 127309 TaxID=2932773 RepID=UPI001FF25539|nr:replication-relaxation family protein [Amycolatopsis sp. WQ 127309]UOZ03418.1 replication-relaxation family protein [Amycolatopsis sp. WQ 127309]